MTRSLALTLTVALALAWLPAIRAQGSRADYERSAGLRSATANKVFRDHVDAHWLPGNTTFWYAVTTGPGRREYVFVEAEKGERRAAFDHARLAETLKGAGLSTARQLLREVVQSLHGFSRAAGGIR